MPKKIHTRVKRKKGQTGTHLKKVYMIRARPSKRGARTFNSEEAAHTWAASKGMKKEDYSLAKVKNFKKFQIIPKNVRVAKMQM